jgi:hypothetical protein
MIARYNRLSLALGVPGLLIQIVGFYIFLILGHRTTGRIVVWIGVALLIAGLALYAKAKGRNPAWGLMGFLSLIGLAVLASLKDSAPNRKEQSRGATAMGAGPHAEAIMFCTHCGASVATGESSCGSCGATL